MRSLFIGAVEARSYFVLGKRFGEMKEADEGSGKDIAHWPSNNSR